MGKIIVLANIAGISNLSLAITLIALVLAFLLFMYLRARAMFGKLEAEIIKPTKTICLQDLPIGRVIVILDYKIKRRNVKCIVQYDEDYCTGIVNRVFKNTFYLELSLGNGEKMRLEKHKTYLIEAVGKGQVRILT